MPATPSRAVRVRLGEHLTVDIVGEDGTRLRVRGRLDSAPDRYTGDTATRLVVVDARAQPLA
jgi:hypothetical protein